MVKGISIPQVGKVRTTLFTRCKNNGVPDIYKFETFAAGAAGIAALRGVKKRPGETMSEYAYRSDKALCGTASYWVYREGIFASLKYGNLKHLQQIQEILQHEPAGSIFKNVNATTDEMAGDKLELETMCGECIDVLKSGNKEKISALKDKISKKGPILWESVGEKYAQTNSPIMQAVILGDNKKMEQLMSEVTPQFYVKTPLDIAKENYGIAVAKGDEEAIDTAEKVLAQLNKTAVATKGKTPLDIAKEIRKV